MNQLYGKSNTIRMDKLFLLKPSFADTNLDENRVFYCPSCAAIEGVLSYYSHLRQKLEVVYVDFPRPRKEIVDLIGEAHQGCPVLVMDEARAGVQLMDFIKEANGKQFINATEGIMQYLAVAYGIGYPHP